MRRAALPAILLAAALSLLPVAGAAAAPGPAASPMAIEASGTPDARYIIQLADAPLVTYDGRLPGLTATAAGKGAMPGVDMRAPANAAYADYLARRQDDFLAALHRVAPAAAPLYHYRVAFNGVTVRLTAAQADVAARLPGVVAVTREEPIVPLMDASLPQLKAPEAWADGRVGGRSAAGRGVRIAIIDSGITAEHPMFDATGFSAPAGFPRSNLTVGDQVINYSAADVARFTNDKVIVARAYVNPEAADQVGIVTPLADGSGGFHGAHVAGSAAGSIVAAGPDGALLSGVAPGAWLMAYKLTYGYTPEILRMIDDAVADGADVINTSWGTAAMNVVDAERHPVSQAFKNAAAAGVVVVAAAGNAGANGEATLGGPQQMIDEVITVANVQTGRTFGRYVLAADADLPAELARHVAQYFAFGNSYDRIEAAAIASDLCDPIDAFRAREKIVLLPLDAACEQSIIQLPIPLPDQLKFLQSLLTAQLVGAKAVVLYGPSTTEAAQIGLMLQVLEVLMGAGGGAPGQTPFQFPVTALISGEQAVALADWAANHPTLSLTLTSTPVPVPDPASLDAADPTSSRGPAPNGPHSPAKPDLAAPGSNILSARTAEDGSPDGYFAGSGTSMASPHVAGAAAVVRQAWPDWTPAEIKAALMTTADPVVTLAGQPAPVTVQGAGRLNLGRAIDPGLLVMPPSLNLGARSPHGEVRVTLTARDVRLAPVDDLVYRLRHEPGPGNTALAPDVPDQVAVPEAGAIPVGITFDLAGLAPGTYDGRIVFDGPTHTVRVCYLLHVPATHKDVLLLNVRRHLPPGAGTFEELLQPVQPIDTPDYGAFWTQALDEVGLSYDVWTVAEGERTGTPPLSVLRAYDLVILAAGDGNAPLDSLPGGMTALQMYLLGGGRMLVSGNKWTHLPSIQEYVLSQGNGAMYYLSRYFAGFERTSDDVALTAPLTPVRLFAQPVALATTTGAGAAGNGGRIDVGRPLGRLTTASTGMTPPPDLGMAAPLVVEKTMPYMRPYLEVAGRGAAMTGVTADATLEHPVAADFIPWRALFAGFPIEAVTTTAGTLSRADLLARVHQWSVEPADVTVDLAGPATADSGASLTFTATTSSPSGVDAVGWRWDAGDGRAYASTTEPRLPVTFDRPGTYIVRVEAMTTAGHTYVAEGRVRVGGLYLPALRKKG